MLKFTYRQIAAHVVNQRQPVQFNSHHTQRISLGIPRIRYRCDSRLA